MAVTINIAVDFDVYKQLTIRRETEATTYNDVIRELVGLSPILPVNDPDEGVDWSQFTDDLMASSSHWITKGVGFPNGTEFRAFYKDKPYSGVVEGGALVVNGKTYRSPSKAANAITESQTNGWRFWQVRLPGKADWVLMETLRPLARRQVTLAPEKKAIDAA